MASWGSHHPLDMAREGWAQLWTLEAPEHFSASRVCRLSSTQTLETQGSGSLHAVHAPSVHVVRKTRGAMRG